MGLFMDWWCMCPASGSGCWHATNNRLAIRSDDMIAFSSAATLPCCSHAGSAGSTCNKGAQPPSSETASMEYRYKYKGGGAAPRTARSRHATGMQYNTGCDERHAASRQRWLQIMTTCRVAKGGGPSKCECRPRTQHWALNSGPKKTFSNCAIWCAEVRCVGTACSSLCSGRPSCVSAPLTPVSHSKPQIHAKTVLTTQPPALRASPCSPPCCVHPSRKGMRTLLLCWCEGMLSRGAMLPRHVKESAKGT